MSPRGFARLALIVVLAAGAMWIVWASTVAAVQRTRNAETALARWADAETQAIAAYVMIQDNQRPETLRRARTLAEAALAREPVSAAAARTLGIIADIERRPDEAERFFNYSERLSRRDVPTQLWFIEKRVRDNDVEGALRHYDRALRVSRDIRNLLFPVLARAASDPNVVDPLARLVASRPPWWSNFIAYLVGQNISSQGMFRIFDSLQLDPQVSDERVLLARAIARLADVGSYDLAASLYRQAKGGTLTAVRNGDFQSPDMDFPPLDWLLVDQSDRSAVREPSARNPDDYVLAVRASSGSVDEVARQLLLLPSNRYRLAVRSGGMGSPSSGPLITITCAGERGASLARLDLPLSENGVSAHQAPFSVPLGGCSAQWLTITARADDALSSAWIDSIAITTF